MAQHKHVRDIFLVRINAIQIDGLGLSSTEQ